MLHKEIIGLTFLGFLLWVIFAADPTERITRICSPVAWTGSAATSISALVAPSSQVGVDRWFKKLDYGCRYTVWRLFYQEQYSAWEAQQLHAGAADKTEKSETKRDAGPQRQDPGAGL